MFQVRIDFCVMELSALEGSSVYMDDTWISVNVSVEGEDVLGIETVQKSDGNNAAARPTSSPDPPEEEMAIGPTQATYCIPVPVTTSTPKSSRITGE